MMQSKINMDNTLWERRSAKATESSILRKEEETNIADLLVIVMWVLMIICEMERSLQSVFIKLNDEIWKERLKTIGCSLKYKVLPPEASIVKMNTLQNSDANAGLWKWTIRAIEKQTGFKSILLEKLSKNVQRYDHFLPKPISIFAYPTSIRTYVEDVIRTPNASQVDLMRHEWARYQTYRLFPRTSKVQPIMLSRAGFYYTGNQDETTCFSCEIKYKNWQSEDSPWEKHRQISPDCAFLKGCDGRNVAIERDEEDTERHQQNSVESVHVENGTSEGANESFPSAHYQYASQANHTEGTMRNSREAQTHEQHEGISNNVASSIGPSSPNISNDRAKHPHYATLSNRLASFTGWLCLTNHQPRDLASAGFYYVGIGDCVRCFFCGGWLRSWQNGDDPSAEHARWYPDCDYIRTFRGEEYLLQHSRDTSSSPEASGYQTLEADPGTSQQELEQNSLRTTAAQIIISMGYSVQKVTQAMETFTMHQGRRDFTVEQLLEIICDAEEFQNNNSCTNPSSNHNANHSYQRQVDVSCSSDLNSASNRNESSNVASNKNESSNVASNRNESSNVASNRNESSNVASNRNESSNVELERQNFSDGIASRNDFESILEENRDLKEQMTCKICMDAEACIVFLPCSHMMTCPQCAPAFRKCPVCRALVRGTVRAFKS